jgi:4-hydroxyphenylacetate 3-monooxygenase
MRTGADYRRCLSQGRKLWIVGQGEVEDVTTHPSTRAMVDCHADWYDRHFDPDWADVLLTAADASGARRPLAFEVPASASDLRRLGKAISRVSFESAGNVTHTPGYGALIALGVLDSVTTMNVSAEQVEFARTYRDRLAATGRFLTFSNGGMPVGFRLRDDPARQAALRVVEQTAGGVVVSGKIGMHTAVPYAEDVYVAGETRLPGGSTVHLIVDLAAPGVRIAARKSAARHANPFLAPLSSRFDELDAQLWLDRVFVPRQRVFLIDPDKAPGGGRGNGVVAWLWWHQQIGWLARAEYILGVALAVADSMGAQSYAPVVEQLVDLLANVQTIRSCVTAAELDPQPTAGGFLLPGLLHLTSAALYNLEVRQRMAEILRNIGGAAAVVAPADTDLADDGVGRDFEDAFGGGGYTAVQRAALLQLASDLVSSSLDGRESSFELLANGGVPLWRQRLRAWFDSYEELANAVLRSLAVDMPRVDLSALKAAANMRRPGPGAEGP